MSKRKVQKDKQRSTEHTHQTKDRVARTPLKRGDEIKCSVMIEDYGMLFNFQYFCFCGHLYFPQHPGIKRFQNTF